MGDDPNQRGLSRKHILHAIDDSLKRLGMDYVDLYQIHRFDCGTPIEETLEALDYVVRSGKALYIGACSMSAWQFAKMLYRADDMGVPRFATMQNHYNVIYREEEREMLPLCREEGIGVIPWSPLARGFVMGNRRREDPGATVRARTDDYGHSIYCQPSDFDMVNRITEVARKRGVSNARIALARGRAATRHHGAHIRRPQARPSGGRRSRARDQAGRFRVEGAGRTVPAASGIGF